MDDGFQIVEAIAGIKSYHSHRRAMGDKIGIKKAGKSNQDDRVSVILHDDKNSKNLKVIFQSRRQLRHMRELELQMADTAPVGKLAGHVVLFMDR